jgi:hypothetical protein
MSGVNIDSYGLQKINTVIEIAFKSVLADFLTILKLKRI